MPQVRTSTRSSRRSLAAGLVIALLATLVALAGPVGAPAQAAPSSEKAARLAITRVGLSCECGGAGYLWGWQVVTVAFSGTRKGHTYKIAMKGRPAVAAANYGGEGLGVVSREQGRFKVGQTYRFTVQEFRGRRLVRSSAARSFRIPVPVAAPRRAHINTLTRDGEEYMVVGQTYRITFKRGQWAKGIRFASGVDRFFGTEDGDDRFGWYGEKNYPLPFKTSTRQPILEFTPTAEFAGTTWGIPVVGYRPAKQADRQAGIKKGDPIPGSEWGFFFTAKVIAAP